MADETDKKNEDERAGTNPEADAIAEKALPSEAPSAPPSSSSTAQDVDDVPSTKPSATAPPPVEGAFKKPIELDAPPVSRRLLRNFFWFVWFFGVPALVAGILVPLLSPPSGVEAHGPFAWLQSFVREQPVPSGILIFSIVEFALWFGRHKLPLSKFAYPELPEGAAVQLQGQFERARGLIDEARQLLAKHGAKVKKPAEVTEAIERLLSSMRAPFSEEEFLEAASHAEDVVEARLGAWRKSEGREYIESILFAVGVALLLRTFVFEAFKIPSGSMIPTLQVGDHIFVNKLSYGPLVPFTTSRVLSQMPPRRGDVMVFRYPENLEQDFIKRVIALPGDKLEARNGHPWINGWEVPSCLVGVYSYSEADSLQRHQGDLYVEFLEEQAYLTLYDHSASLAPELQGPYYVKQGEAWVMGDNRHNSHDSRLWWGGQGGGVPFANIKGRALFVWLSVGDKGMDWSRLGAPVMGRPRLPPAMAQLEGGLSKCLRERPPMAKTRPPAP